MESWKPSNYDRLSHLNKKNQTIPDSMYNIKHLHNDGKVPSILSYFMSFWIIWLDLISYWTNIIYGEIEKHKELISHVELSTKKRRICPWKDNLISLSASVTC
jgi:hypothetical protein